MSAPELAGRHTVESLIAAHVPFFNRLGAEDQERLRALAADLKGRGLPAGFIGASLESTAQVLRDLKEEESQSDNVFQRENVRRFIEENAVTPTLSPRFAPRRERKREERERLFQHTQRLLREARQARGRHEVKKTRNMLLNLDQRELRRVLGADGDDLCRQINTWLRGTAPMF